jgi:hypothetical protein
MRQLSKTFPQISGQFSGSGRKLSKPMEQEKYIPEPHEVTHQDTLSQYQSALRTNA